MSCLVHSFTKLLHSCHSQDNEHAYQFVYPGLGFLGEFFCAIWCFKNPMEIK